MRKFIKGKLETVVEDNDRRIPEYLASGWEDVELPAKPQDAADTRIEKAMLDVENSEREAGKKKSGRKPTKKVNAAIKANTTAIAESEAVDDGLFKKKEGE